MATPHFSGDGITTLLDTKFHCGLENMKFKYHGSKKLCQVTNTTQNQYVDTRYNSFQNN